MYVLFYLRALSDCTRTLMSEQSAAEVLGYTQVVWDNMSGKEPKRTELYGTTFLTIWARLTFKERAAAHVLGYTEKIWDNKSGSEPQPASASKPWSKLTVCGERVDAYCTICLLCLFLLRLLVYACWDYVNGHLSPFSSFSSAYCCDRMLMLY